MKKFYINKRYLLGIFLTLFFNGCSISDENKKEKRDASDVNFEHKIVFTKSTTVDWNYKKVEISFEDAFQDFMSIEQLSRNAQNQGYVLSNNNLKQGITIKIKVVDRSKNNISLNEIMIEPYDLKKGVNEFTIGYNDNKPNIMY